MLNWAPVYFLSISLLSLFVKTKLAPLTLLIPAIVLAQPGPAQNPPSIPQPSMMQNPPTIPANPADALSNAKKQAKELKSKAPSNGDVGSSSSNLCTNGCGTNTTTYT
jgi:hypothetical protein